ncbi:MAG: hypothetical protein IKV45_04830 [Firmicutes bacterium]|nr:hypothetical protein [Bacillota bacterium]
MFPLTHIYTAKAVLGRENRLTALGCLFPDYGAFLGLGRNLCHEMSLDMYHFAAEYLPDHIDFALGALTHGTSLPGIDWYADEEYHGIRPGFCFQKGELICDQVAACCNLPQNIALWKTHNIIELAFDVITEKKNPGIGQFALANMPKDGEPFCTAFLRSYLNRSDADIRAMYTEVTDIFSFDGNNIDEMADKFILSLERRHNIKNCKKNDLMDLILQAVDIVEPLYDDFMAEAIEAITSELHKRTGITRP